MSRTAIPLYVGDQLITVAHANTYWRDNEAAAWPYDSIGGLAYATGAADLAELEMVDAGDMVCVHDDGDKPYWDGWVCGGIKGYPLKTTVANNTLTVLTLDELVYEKTPPGTFVATPTQDRITIPAGWDGWYLITSNTDWVTDANGTRIAYAYKNGAVILENVYISTAAVVAGGTANSVAGLVYLVATDYIQIRCWQNSGGNLDMVAATLELSLVLGG